MQEHPWLDRLYVKLALQVKKTEQKTKKLALIELKMQKIKIKKARRADSSNPLWWVGMQMDYGITKKLNLRAGLYSGLRQPKVKRKTVGTEGLTSQPCELVQVTACHHRARWLWGSGVPSWPAWGTSHGHPCRRQLSWLTPGRLQALGLPQGALRSFRQPQSPLITGVGPGPGMGVAAQGLLWD